MVVIGGVYNILKFLEEPNFGDMEACVLTT